MDYNRTADNAIYEEDRYEQPKEIFKETASLLKLDSPDAQNSALKLLDIGTATGEFLYYLRKINPLIQLDGAEYSSHLVNIGKDFLKKHDINLMQGDANQLTDIADSTYDYVTTLGVTSIFDDFRPSYDEMVRITKPGGKCINLMLVNELAIDVIIKYINPKTQELEAGWNKFSLDSIGKHLEAHPRVSKHSFTKHHMPFDIEKRDDLMRSWTKKDENGKRILWNGMNMEITMYYIEFEVSK